MNEEPRIRHLEPEEFFLLAFPPAGEPEALAPHLSACGACARQLAEWRRAARELESPAGAPSSDFERIVMERVRSSPAPRSRRNARRIGAGVAVAACLAGAFYLGTRLRTAAPVAAEAPTAPAMTEADRADDELLRDVSRMVSEDDGAPWKSVAPLPDPTEGEGTS